MATGVHLYGIPCRSYAAAGVVAMVDVELSLLWLSSSTIHSSEQ